MGDNLSSYNQIEMQDSKFSKEWWETAINAHAQKK